MEYYGRVIELWRECDAELRPMLALATAGLERLGGAGRIRAENHRMRAG